MLLLTRVDECAARLCSVIKLKPRSSKTSRGRCVAKAAWLRRPASENKDRFHMAIEAKKLSAADTCD